MVGQCGSVDKLTFFNQHHLGTAQAVAEVRANNITGPLFVGKDTHALSELRILFNA